MALATPDGLEASSQRLQAALVQARAILSDPDDHRPQGRALFAIYDMAEQMRLLLLVVHHMQQELRKEPSESREELNDLEQILLDLARQRTSGLLIGAHQHLSKTLEAHLYPPSPHPLLVPPRMIVPHLSRNSLAFLG